MCCHRSYCIIIVANKTGAHSSFPCSSFDGCPSHPCPAHPLLISFNYPAIPATPHPHSSYTNPTRQMDCDVCKSWHCEIVRAHRRLLYMLITDTESTSYGKRKTELGYHTPYCNFGKKFELHKLIKYTFQTDSKMQLV